MGVDFYIGSDGNRIVRTVTGKLSAHNIIENFNQSLTRPDYKTNMDVIWDISQANTSSLDSAEFCKVVTHIFSNLDTRGNHEIPGVHQRSRLRGNDKSEACELLACSLPFAMLLLT